jgi:hypothetical protein
MSRNMIGRLARRVEALEEARKPPSHRRVLRVIVKNHLETEREIAQFKAEQGTTDVDLVIARVIVGSTVRVPFLFMARREPKPSATVPTIWLSVPRMQIGRCNISSCGAGSQFRIHRGRSM